MQDSHKTFSDLGLSDNLVKAYNSLNYFIPSPIQEKAIPLGLQGTDLISQSKAGTGKTLAFLGILFSKLILTEQTTQAIIVLPTRELAFQIFDMLRRVAKKLPGPAICESACFIGGIPIDNDRTRLQNSVVHVVVGTPGRLKALIKEKLLVLENMKMLILDEADKLLDVAGFGDDVYHLMGKLKGKCQFLAFSATIEEKILEKLKSNMQNPSIVFLAKEEMNASEQQMIAENDSNKIEEEKKLDLNITNLRQYYVRVESGAKGINLAKNLKVIEILKNVNYDQAIIFYNDKALGEDLASDLREEGITLNFIHGDQSQAERIKIMNKFKLKKVNVILSTDLLSRGIDVENIGLVINYDVPTVIETYFHRIGRTGRFSKYGVSILFIRDKDDDFLFKNKNYFVNIVELPQSFEEINEFLKNNQAVQAKRDETIKQMLTEQGKKMTNPKKEYHYTAESELTKWVSVEHQFYDEVKFKYYEDPVELMNEGMQISDELDTYKRMLINEQIAKEKPQETQKMDIIHAEKPADGLEFLKCRHCYETALQMQKNLNVSLEILQYFAIDENYKH